MLQSVKMLLSQPLIICYSIILINVHFCFHFLTIWLIYIEIHTHTHTFENGKCFWNHADFIPLLYLSDCVNCSPSFQPPLLSTSQNNKQSLASVVLTAPPNPKSHKLTSGIFPHANSVALGSGHATVTSLWVKVCHRHINGNVNIVKG